MDTLRLLGNQPLGEPGAGKLHAGIYWGRASQRARLPTKAKPHVQIYERRREQSPVYSTREDEFILILRKFNVTRQLYSYFETRGTKYMDNVIFKLTEVITNILIRSKLGGDKCDNYTDIVTALGDLGLDAYQARAIGRVFDSIGDSLASSCETILENSPIQQPTRRQIIVQYVLKAYESLKINYETIISLINNVSGLKRKLLTTDLEYKKQLDPIEIEVFTGLIDHTAHFLIGASMKLPGFNQYGIKRLLGQLDELEEKMAEAIKQLENVYNSVNNTDIKTRNFERYYRNQIINQYKYINVFGAGFEREYKRYQIEIAYVQLAMSDDRTGNNIDINRLLTVSRNVWLSGDAGLGKTTLLQWIAVCSAENNKKIKGIRDTVPVFIELRKTSHKQLGLKDCIMKVMKDSSYTIPEGWIEDSIQAGKFVFLIDGFDEVDANARENVLKWLQEIDGKEKCRKIFSSRPQVKVRPRVKQLLEVRIVPMNWDRIVQFVHYWHKAVLLEQLKVDSSEIDTISSKLIVRINESEALKKLASNPLLCAMICALHYRNDMNLPLSKRELYEECCKMLLEKRDLEREIYSNNVSLEYGQKKIIIAQLAYWMMKNNHVEIDRDQAETSVKRSISGMQVDKSNEKAIFKYLFERSGLLRELEIGKINFIHRTFQEYLAAYEISRQDDWGYIKEKIGDDTWEETIGMCIGYARKKIASDIIEHTLCKGTELDEKKYYFLAIIYMSGAIEVEESLRKRVEEKIEQLIPPKELECQGLSEAGNIVVPLLKYKSEYNEQQCTNCIRTLKLIGTEKALNISKSYFDKNLSKNEIKELGYIVDEFSLDILMQYEFHKCIKGYISRQNGNSMVVPESFIRTLSVLPKEEYMSLFYNIEELQISDYRNFYYTDECKGWDVKDAFSKVHTLKIGGCFSKISILKGFTNIKKLQIYCTSDAFDLEQLKDYYNIDNVKEFTFITSHSVYINGRCLNFLKNCEKIRLVILNDSSELHFEYFDELPKLTELEVVAEFALELLEFEYPQLPSSIQRLTVFIPNDQIKLGEDLANELNFQVNIQSFEDECKSLMYY